MTSLVEVFLKGLLVGLIVAFPIGPVGMLCLQRTLARGSKVGLASGLGTALGNALFGAVAAFGVQFASSFIGAHHFAIEVFGGLVLAAFGAGLLLSRRAPSAPADRGRSGLAAAFATALLLTLANPATLFFLVAAAAASGLGRQDAQPLHAGLFVVALSLGASTWWVAVAAAGNWLRRRLATRVEPLQRLAGGVMLGAGLGVAAVRLAEHWREIS